MKEKFAEWTTEVQGLKYGVGVAGRGQVSPRLSVVLGVGGCNRVEKHELRGNNHEEGRSLSHLPTAEVDTGVHTKQRSVLIMSAGETLHEPARRS